MSNYYTSVKSIDNDVNREFFEKISKLTNGIAKMTVDNKCIKSVVCDIFEKINTKCYTNLNLTLNDHTTVNVIGQNIVY